MPSPPGGKRAHHQFADFTKAIDAADFIVLPIAYEMTDGLLAAIFEDGMAVQVADAAKSSPARSRIRRGAEARGGAS